MVVGDVLREKREQKGISLEDIASKTNIRISYLHDLENGNYETIPSEIYVKGYLKLVAESLGLDVSDILALYSEEREKVYGECREEPLDSHKYGIKNIIIFGIGSLIIIFALVSVFLFIGNSDDMQYSKGSSVFFHQKGHSGVGVTGPHLLKIIANETTWIMMVIDNKKVEEYILKRGDVITKKGNEGFYIKVGNAGGVSVFLDNENMGNLGKKGEVVKVSIPQDFKLARSLEKMFQIKKPL
ncbi:helix-turn-helix domain protein [bacterium BMS3Abin07]|nr:helix-turn-helix domain protein [bacterium BMS3Abin07]GBE32527.1 helix-turn-helix domain protein [bacterium BMS3Bbin05]HDO23430.1 helix-turn-helix domain-containing protein [Nitrospirota bacterium]HDZ88078.1 helix-turn-helix domain-containing protein [Nitrospirota bacterium]